MTKLILKLVPLVITLGVIAVIIGFEPEDRRWQLIFALTPFVVAFGICKFVAGDFDRSSTALALVAGFVCGVLGGIQLGAAGLVAGGLVGFMAADFLLCLPLGVVSGVLGMLGIYIRRQPDGEEEHVPAYPMRLLAAVVRLAGVAYLAFVCHEMYWFLNIGADALSAQVGGQIVRSTSTEDTRGFLQQRVTEQRWPVAAFRAPPIQYALRPPANENSQAALQLIDLLGGRAFRAGELAWYQPPTPSGAGSDQGGSDQGGTDQGGTDQGDGSISREDEPAAELTAADFNDEQLNQIGAELTLAAIDDIKFCFGQTLYVRRVLNVDALLKAAEQLRQQVEEARTRRET